MKIQTTSDFKEKVLPQINYKKDVKIDPVAKPKEHSNYIEFLFKNNSLINQVIYENILN